MPCVNTSIPRSEGSSGVRRGVSALHSTHRAGPFRTGRIKFGIYRLKPGAAVGYSARWEKSLGRAAARVVSRTVTDHGSLKQPTAQPASGPAGSPQDDPPASLRHEAEKGASVIVAVDQMPASLPVLRWAAQTAWVHGGSLTIIYVMAKTSGGVPFDILSAADDRVSAARWTLADAAAAARSWQPGLAVATRLIHDEPGHGLLANSTNASLLVLGSGTHGELHDRLFGSSARHCITHGRVPVALVPARSDDLDPRPPRLVVGIDDTPAASATLRFALTEAAVRNLTAHVVHTWTDPIQPPTSSMAMPIPADVISCRDVAQRILDDALTAARTAAPGVTVTCELANAAPETALADASRHAQLLIVGHHHHSRLVDLVLGSVCDHVMHRSGCPVIVVPHPHETE